MFGNCIHQGDQSILCMHRIPMKDNEENSIETTNTKSHNGEIVKWLDACLIYSISDSVWVNPIQRMLKKSGMTLMGNEKN